MGKSAPVYPIKVQTVSEWRRESRAARDAGTASPSFRLSFGELCKCRICGIYVGCGYAEEDLYFWPVKDIRLCLEETIVYLPGLSILSLCGGCARRRQLPERYLVLEPSYWQSTRVLFGEDGSFVFSSAADLYRLRRAVRRHLQACLRLFQSGVVPDRTITQTLHLIASHTSYRSIA